MPDVAQARALLVAYCKQNGLHVPASAREGKKDTMLTAIALETAHKRRHVTAPPETRDLPSVAALVERFVRLDA